MEYTVERITSVHDSGTPICNFPTREAAEAYAHQLEDLETEEMCAEGYWYEVH